MSLRVLALRVAPLLVLVGLAFAAEPAKAQYYGGCGYGCGSYVVVPSYGCGSCASYSYAPVVVQPVAPCGGCGGYGYYGGHRYGGWGGYRYGGYRWGPRRWGYGW